MAQGEEKNWLQIAQCAGFAVVDGIHLWVSVPFNMLYPVNAVYMCGLDSVRSIAKAKRRSQTL